MRGGLTTVSVTAPRRRAATLIGLACLLACQAVAGYGQLVEVTGGTSSLYQSQGGSILLHGATYESEVGAGLISGRFVAGGRIAYRDKDTVYSAGIEEIRFNLPTDIFAADHRLLGVGVDLKSTRPGNSLELFAGGTSQHFETPLFTGVRVDQPAAAFILQHSFSPTVATTTEILAADPSTALQAVKWTPRPWLKLAATGGFGGTSHYEAISADMKRPLVDFKAAYIDAPLNFNRLGSDPTISPEPIHENLQFTVRSSRNPLFTASGGRQNFMVPTSTVTTPNGTVLPNLISTSNQLSVSTTLKPLALNATAIQSSYDGQSNIAFVYSASAVPSRRLRLQTSYFQSHLVHESSLLGEEIKSPSTSTVVTSVQETLSQRYGLNQTITYSNGQTSIGYGGSIFSNFITFSADYETFYVPTRPSNPFQQTLILDLQLSLFGRITLHGANFVSPTGKILYTANMRAVEARSGAAGPGAEHTRFGLYIVQGRVVDTNGDPLPGAAIGIGTNVLFTDSLGEFFLRDKKPRNYTFRVFGDEFLDGHTYRVISQPEMVPGTKTEDQHLLIIVKRVADRPAAPPESSPCTRAVGPGKKQPPASRLPLCDDKAPLRQTAAKAGRSGS